MHSKGKVSMYKPGTRPEELNGKIAVVQKEDKEAKTDDDDFVQTKS